MATSTRKIPDELLVDTLGRLSKKDLKKARLVCSLWGSAGARWMFQRVYFAPRNVCIKDVTAIAANPTFTRNVKELIYDGRLFLPRLGNFASYWSAFHARAIEKFDIYEDHKRNALSIAERNHATEVYQGSMWNMKNIGAGENMKRVNANYHQKFNMNVGNSLVRYVRLLDEQESILRQSGDFKALCEGLKSFRNISKASATVDFARCTDYMTNTNDRQNDYIDGHEWYNTRSKREFGLTVPPSRWCRRDRDHRGGDQDQEEHIQWDVRGVQNLFRALSMHCPTLKELRIASMYYKAPMTIFQLSDTDIEKARTMFRCLTSLQLHPYVTKSADGTEYARQSYSLEHLLQEAKELRFLSSSRCFLEDDLERLDDRGYERPDFATFLGKVWPHLTKLILTHACVKADDLMSIFQANSESLRALELDGIELLDKQGWEHFGKEMGQLLKLHFVQVYALHDSAWEVSREFWPYVKQSRTFVHDMMQWALPDIPEIEERHKGRVTGRLKVGSS